MGGGCRGNRVEKRVIIFVRYIKSIIFVYGVEKVRKSRRRISRRGGVFSISRSTTRAIVAFEYKITIITIIMRGIVRRLIGVIRRL